ncbi:MAG: TolC family protein [Calditrichia bacterium]
MKKSSYLFWTILLAMFITARAQMQSLGLETALTLALKNNLTLQKSLNTLQLGQISLAQNKMSLLPSLSLSGSYSSRKNVAENGNPVNNFSAGFSSQLNLFNGFADMASIRQARQNFQAQDFTVQRLRETVIYTTVQLYLNTQLAAEWLEIQKADLQAQQEQYRKIQSAYRAGNKSRADLLQQEAELSESRRQLYARREQLAIQKARLLTYLNLSPEDSLALKEVDLTDWLTLPLSGPDSLDGRRADLMAAKTELQAAREEIALARSGFFPTVNLSLSAGSNYSNAPFSGSFHSQFWDENPYISGSLSFTLPLFDRFRTKYAVESAKIRYKTSHLSLREKELETRQEVYTARYSARTALKQLEATRNRLAYSREAYQIQKAKYETGTISFVDFSQARVLFLQAQLDLAATRVEAALKILNYYYSLGILNTVVRF